MLNENNDIEKLIDDIGKSYLKGNFKYFIEYIRFPFYKNLQLNSEIIFNFPLTVLVGQNGSGKSSALHAIYGMPEGYSTGIFWFATSVDPIVDDSKNRPGFVYGYKNEDGEILEVVKTRIGAAKGGHYWEPSRPLGKWGMKKLGGSRNPTIVKEVFYLDFRSELSAYDKYFYFSNFQATKTIKTKQDAIRKKSKHLKRVIDSNTAHSYFTRQINQPIILNSNELNEVNKILGKKYVECKLIKHNLYAETQGLTIYFKTLNIAYSEAFAGRGEFAVVKLVYEIMNKPNYSLIVLDEPEVSLHSGAQEKLLEFLLKQTLQKKLQVVISTHSPKFVQFLPPNAIKLFYNDEGVRFNIKNQCHYLEAFQRIGETILDTSKKIIFVEDVLSQMLVEKILSDLKNELSLIFIVNFLPGGADNLYIKAAGFSQEGEFRKFIILDGDKTKQKIEPAKMKVEEYDNFTSLDITVKEITGLNFNSLRFSIDSNGNTGGNQNQKKIAAQKFIGYLYTNLDYLPKNKIPEDLIWDSDYAKSLLKTKELKESYNSSDNKKKLFDFTRDFVGDNTINSFQTCLKLFIQNFICKKNADYQEIVSILEKFKNC
ncbi:MAG TPA: AAA family ATPase [Puia sp.]|nr:AAA family ATPase [Puia sp.]